MSIETPRKNEVAASNTDVLLDRLSDILDEYGQLATEIDGEPGMVRQAGFLAHDKNSRFLTSNVVIVTEWVGMNLPGCPRVYQVDDRAHVIEGARTTVVDEYTDENQAKDILDYIVDDVKQEQSDAYHDPENAWVIKSLMDPEGYEKDISRAKDIGWRQKRAERKALERAYIENGTRKEMAAHLARMTISRRYS